MAYDTVEIGADGMPMDDEGIAEVGFRMPWGRSRNRGALAQRAAAAMRARQAATMQNVARGIGSPRVQLVGKVFQVQANMGPTAVTATGTERPLQGFDPKKTNIYAYDTGGGSAAGQDLLEDVKVASDSQLSGIGGIPIEQFSPDANNPTSLNLPRIESQTPVQVKFSRTAAPGIGVTRIYLTTFSGVTFSAG